MRLKVQTSGVPQLLLHKTSQISFCTERRSQVDITPSVSGCPGFKSFWVIGFHLFVETNKEIVPQIKSELFHARYFRIYDLLIIPSFDVISLN
jgi:hypothetical protein